MKQEGYWFLNAQRIQERALAPISIDCRRSSITPDGVICIIPQGTACFLISGYTTKRKAILPTPRRSLWQATWLATAGMETTVLLNICTGIILIRSDSAICFLWTSTFNTCRQQSTSRALPMARLGHLFITNDRRCKICFVQYRDLTVFEVFHNLPFDRRSIGRMRERQ